jgi:hypothetical protein
MILALSQELKSLYIGLDVGQKRDRTVLSLIEKIQEYGDDPFEGKNRIGKPFYKLVYLDRFALGIPMPQQIDRVIMTYERIIQKYNEDPPANKRLLKPTLIIDMGNVGRALFDQFCQVKSSDYGRMNVFGINFLGDGAGVSKDGNVYGVSKKDLASALAVVIENDRLIIPSNIPDRSAIIQELARFTWKISQAGNLTVENLKDADHDDIPCSLMVAIWFAEEMCRRIIDDDTMKALIKLRQSM